MKHQVFWKNPGYKKGKAVTGKRECRYLVVGAGITGLSLAYFLLEGGVDAKDIIVVEAEYAGGGSTGHSAGMLIPEMETEENVGWEAIIERYGVKLAKAYRHAHIEALHTIEKIIRKGKIHCDASKGDFLTLARDSAARERVMTDIQARRMMGERPAGLRGTYLMNEFGSPGFVFAERTLPGLSVNPLALAQGIATYLRRQGVSIYENSPVISTYRDTARFAHGAITFSHIIYARGVGEKHAKLNKYVTTIAVTRKLSREQIKELRLADLDLFIDEEGLRSFHYGKITGDGRLLLGYGDVKVRADRAETTLHRPHIRNIERFIKKMFPHAKLPIHYAWSAIYAIQGDLLPLIRVKGNSVLINGAGIQLGSVTAAGYAASILLGTKHPLKGLWHPEK